MGFIERIKSLFIDEKNNNDQQADHQVSLTNDQSKDPGLTYEDVPECISVDLKDYPIVAVIASSIAAGAYSESEFKVKDIKVKNPEFMRVAIIASSIASTYNQETNLSIRKIQKVREMNA
ncbi:hypothetical protein ACN2AU_05605 [Aerococcus viridans]